MQMKKHFLTSLVLLGAAITAKSAFSDDIQARFGEGVCSGPWQFIEKRDCDPQPIRGANENDTVDAADDGTFPVEENFDESGKNAYYYRLKKVGFDYVREADGSRRKLYLGVDFDTVTDGQSTLVARECIQPINEIPAIRRLQTYEIRTKTDNFPDFITSAHDTCQASREQALVEERAAHPEGVYQVCANPDEDCTQFNQVSSLYIETTNPANGLKYLGFETSCSGTVVAGQCVGSIKKTHVAQCTVEVLEKLLAPKKDAKNCGTMIRYATKVAKRYPFNPALKCKYVQNDTGLPVNIDSLNLYQATDTVAKQSGVKVTQSGLFLTSEDIKKQYPFMNEAVCLTGETMPVDGRFQHLRDIYNTASINGYGASSRLIQLRTAAYIRRYQANELTEEEAAFRNSVLRIAASESPDAILSTDFQVQFSRPAVPSSDGSYNVTTKVTLPAQAEYAAVCLKKKENCNGNSDWTYLTLDSFSLRSNVFMLAQPIDVNKTPYFTFRTGIRQLTTIRDTINLSSETERQTYVIESTESLNSRFVKSGPDTVSIVLGTLDSLVKSFSVTPNYMSYLSADKKFLMIPSDNLYIYNLETGALVETIPMTGQPVFTSIDDIKMIEQDVIRDVRTGEIKPFPSAGSFYLPALSSNGRYIAQFNESDQTMRVWDVKEAKLLTTNPLKFVRSYRTWSYRFSPDSRKVLFKGHDDDNLRMIDLETGTLTDLRLPAYAQGFDIKPTGDVVVVTHGNEKLDLVDISTGAVIKTLSGTPGKRYYDVKVSGNGLYAVAGDELFSLENGKERFLNSISLKPNEQILTFY